MKGSFRFEKALKTQTNFGIQFCFNDNSLLSIIGFWEVTSSDESASEIHLSESDLNEFDSEEIGKNLNENSESKAKEKSGKENRLIENVDKSEESETVLEEVNNNNFLFLK